MNLQILREKNHLVSSILPLVFLFSVVLDCSGQEVESDPGMVNNTENTYEVQLVQMSDHHYGYDPSDLQAEYNETSLDKLLGRYADDAVPLHYDWREDYKYNVVLPPENQIPCASCWVFSSLYMLECQYAIKTRRLVSLSKQQVVDCLKPGEGCNGWGTPFEVFAYVKKYGLQGTQSYGPYLGEDGTCHYNQKKVILSVRGDFKSFEGHDSFLKILYHSGPITALLIAPESYGGGILTVEGDQCPDISRINHSVLLVGYGVSPEGIKYWIAKNTYGPNQGVKGYFKIERGRNTLCIEQYGTIANIVV